MLKALQRLGIALAAYFCLTAAYATTLGIESDGTANISSGAHTIFLDGGSGVTAYHHVSLWTSSTAANIYFTLNPGVNASTSNALLIAGSGFTYGLNSPPGPATNQINYYGASSAGTISWLAW